MARRVLRLHLKQPDRQSCGAASVVVARMLCREDDVALGADPQEGFATEVLAAHRGLTGVRDEQGRWQLPWPRALGTPPWAVARALTDATGRRHRTRVVRWRRVRTLPPLSAVYVGNRWSPRHVCLVVEPEDDTGIAVYEPASGRVVVLPDGLHADGTPLGGWRYGWFAVRPR